MGTRNELAGREDARIVRRIAEKLQAVFAYGSGSDTSAATHLPSPAHLRPKGASLRSYPQNPFRDGKRDEEGYRNPRRSFTGDVG
jgi:hypothetical protein